MYKIYIDEKDVNAIKGGKLDRDITWVSSVYSEYNNYELIIKKIKKLPRPPLKFRIKTAWNKFISYLLIIK